MIVLTETNHSLNAHSRSRKRSPSHGLSPHRIAAGGPKQRTAQYLALMEIGWAANAYRVGRAGP